MSDQQQPQEAPSATTVVSDAPATEAASPEPTGAGGTTDTSTAVTEASPEPSAEPSGAETPNNEPTASSQEPTTRQPSAEATVSSVKSQPTRSESPRASSSTGQSKSTRSVTRQSRTDASASPSAGATSTRSSGKSKRKRMKLGDLDLTNAKIGFIGAGKMAESTINGLIHYGKISPKQIHVAAPSTKNLERFKTLGCRVTKRDYDIFGRYDCDIVFLAFHGYVIKHCYKLGGPQRPHPLTTNYIPHQRHPVYILSLVSGVSLSQIKKCLLNPESENRYVVEIHRIMMNTAVGHGLGICAIDCEPDSKKLSAPLRQLLSSIAQLEHVPASQMDAACAVGGSGLAFCYYFINSLADGAFKMGLSRQQAIRFASKTAQCAAQTMLESGKHPAELRDNVSSPSGAAIYGIHVLEKNDVASGVTAAVEAAHKRAHELAVQDVG